MADEQVRLINAQDQANQYMRWVEEAVAAEGPDEMRQHIQEAMAFGQNALDHLDEALSMTEDPDVADRVKEAMYHLGLSMDQGDQVLDASEEDIEDFISEMRRHARQSTAYLGEAMAAAM